ncbi:MAG: immunoglobulin-like domain-containing protein [Candidatus Buchananbacteria bacterium]|jgi:hypothetical protein
MTVLLAMMFIVAGVLPGCPPVQQVTPAPAFDYEADTVQRPDGTWDARAFVKNDNVQKVTFQLMSLSAAGQWMPEDAVYTTQFGVVENVTLHRVDMNYQNQPVYWFQGCYYVYDYQGRYFPLPYAYAMSHQLNVTSVTARVQTMEIVHGDGAYLFAVFENLDPGTYKVRVTGISNEVPPRQFVPAEVFLDPIPGQPGTVENVNIRFTDVPEFGDLNGILYGVVTGVPVDQLSNYAVAVYLSYQGVWYIKPGYGQAGFTPIIGGNWGTDVTTGGSDHLADQYLAVVVPKTAVLPSTSIGQQPYVAGTLASAYAVRVPVDHGDYDTNGSINFTEVSAYGDQNGMAHGVITGIPSAQLGNYRVAVYIKKVDGVLHLKPNCGVLVLVNTDGTWSCDITMMPDDERASQVIAYLVPVGTSVPCEIRPTKAVCGGDIPCLDDAVASVAISRVPLIAFTYVPVYGDTEGILKGVASSIHQELFRVAVVERVGGGWWTKPSFGNPLSDIGSDGRWACDITTGGNDQNATEIWAYLVPFWCVVPTLNGQTTLPTPEDFGAVAYVWVNRGVGRDIIPPVITRLGTAEMTVEVYSASHFSDPGATATDDVDGNITSRIVVAGTVNMTVIGNYVLTYNVSDTAGNSAMPVTRMVHVVRATDTTPPVITILGYNPDTVLVGSGSYPHLGAHAVDNYDGDISTNITYVSTVNTSVVGNYTITYTVSDAAGNTATATRVVHVVRAADTTPPVITLLGQNPQTVEVNSAAQYTDPGATATDDNDGNLTAAIVITGTVDIHHVGQHALTYNVHDGSGNVAVPKTRTVYVVDTTRPIINPLADITLDQEASVEVTLAGSDSYDPAPVWSATGFDSGLITVSIVGTKMTVTAKTTAGNTTITVKLTDSSGNFASQVVHVTVNPAGLPTIDFNRHIPEFGNVEDFSLQGNVRNIDPAAARIAVYIRVADDAGVKRWWTKPDFGGSRYTIPNPDRTWACNIVTGGRDQYAGEILAFLIANNVTAPELIGTEAPPSIPDSQVLARAWVDRTPRIMFTSVPPYGAVNGSLQGVVTGVDPAMFKIAVYIKVTTLWSIKPAWQTPLTTINADGSWACNIVTVSSDANATDIMAFLVANGESVPLCGHDPVAQTTPPEIPHSLAVQSVIRQH